MNSAALLVTIDTEEEGLWSGSFRRDGNTVRNVSSSPRFQALCDRFQVIPTYLVDWPVVQDPHAASLLREYQDSGRAEIGAHLHPWCNPPFEEQINDRNSYLCNLPADLQARKLRLLTEAIEERFGRRPSSFRAGRYGLDAVGARLLVLDDYMVDSSVTPLLDHSADGGPDFTDFPFRPYFPAEDSLRSKAPAGKLLEIPVTVGYTRPGFERRRRWDQRMRTPLLRKLRAPGVLDRLGLLRRVKLSPEKCDAETMNRLIDAAVSDGAECVVLMFHSSSLAPGLTPYVRDAAALERFHSNLQRVFEHCLGRNLTAPSLTQFAATARQDAAAAGAV